MSVSEAVDILRTWRRTSPSATQLNGKSGEAAKKKIVSELSDTEKDLLWHMENGYQLETDSLGSDPVLRRLEDDDVVRPPSANRSTIAAMEEKGLITQGKSCDPLKIVWRVKGNLRIPHSID